MGGETRREYAVRLVHQFGFDQARLLMRISAARLEALINPPPPPPAVPPQPAPPTRRPPEAPEKIYDPTPVQRPAPPRFVGSCDRVRLLRALQARMSRSVDETVLSHAVQADVRDVRKMLLGFREEMLVTFDGNGWRGTKAIVGVNK